jgi:Dolichyl-phosphate-mannose-protein mannosyltransferase
MEGAGADDAGGQSEPSPSVAARVFVTLSAALLACGALLLLAVSLAPYSAVKHRLDRFASDHAANFSIHRFHEAVWQLRGLSFVLALVAVGIALRRRVLAEIVQGFSTRAVADTRVAARSIRGAAKSSSALHRCVLLTLVVVGALIRIRFLFQPMRYDESGTYVHYASKPLYIGLTTYTAPNNHLLNTVLIHFTTALFGNHPWAIRLPALLAGCALVPATYGLARVVYGARSALVAAALVATSSTLIEYSTNARGYTAVSLAFVLLLTLAPFLAKTASVAGWATLVVVGALGFLAIPTMVYAFGAAAVWLAILIWRERRAELFKSRFLPAVASTILVSAVLYAPAAAASGVHALIGNSFVTPHSWGYFWGHLPGSLAATFRRWHRDQPTALWIAFLACFLGALVFHRRIARVSVPPVVGAALFIPPVLVLQHVIPFERVWLFLVPLYFVTVAAGIVIAIEALAPARHAAGLSAALAIALCAGLAAEAAASRAVSRSEDTSTFRDASAVARYIERHVAPSERVLVSPPADLILEYYLDSAGFDAGRMLYTNPKTGRMLVVVKLGTHDYSLEQVLRQHLSKDRIGRSRIELLERFPHARIYELRPRGTYTQR